MEFLKMLYYSDKRPGANIGHPASIEKLIQAEDRFKEQLPESLLLDYTNLSSLNETVCDEERYHEFVSGFTACALIMFDVITLLSKEK